MYTDYILIFLLVFALLLILIAISIGLKINQLDREIVVINLPEVQIKTVRFLLSGVMIALISLLFLFPQSGLSQTVDSGKCTLLFQVMLLAATIGAGNLYFRSFFIGKMAGNNRVHYIQDWLKQLSIQMLALSIFFSVSYIFISVNQFHVINLPDLNSFFRNLMHSSLYKPAIFLLSALTAMIAFVFYYLQRQHLDEKWLRPKNLFFRSFITLTLINLFSQVTFLFQLIPNWPWLFSVNIGFVGHIVVILVIISMISLDNFTYCLKYRLRFDNPYYPVKLNLHLNRLLIFSVVMLFIISLTMPLMQYLYM